MNVVTTDLPGVLIIEPKVFGDERGFFYESFNAKAFKEATGLDTQFVQDNHSRSQKGVLRGLHYQLENTQGQTGPGHARVKCLTWPSTSVAARRISANGWPCAFLRRIIVSSGSRKGFAHGFVVLSDFAEVLYKTTDYYTPSAERSIRWDDPDLAIDWQLDMTPQLSAKDQAGGIFQGRRRLRLKRTELTASRTDPRCADCSRKPRHNAPVPTGARCS